MELRLPREKPAEHLREVALPTIQCPCVSREGTRGRPIQRALNSVEPFCIRYDTIRDHGLGDKREELPELLHRSVFPPCLEVCVPKSFTGAMASRQRMSDVVE